MKIRAILASDDTSTANVVAEVKDTQMTYVTGSIAKYLYLPVTPPIEVETFSEIPEIMLGMKKVVNPTSRYPDPALDYWTYQPVDGL